MPAASAIALMSSGIKAAPTMDMTSAEEPVLTAEPLKPVSVSEKTMG